MISAMNEKLKKVNNHASEQIFWAFVGNTMEDKSVYLYTKM